MKNVLLVIPPGVRPRTGLHHALNRASAAGSKLVALVILDPSETVRIAARLDDAFLGERVGDRVIKALEREQFVRAEDLLTDIASEASGAGIDVVRLIESGDTTEVCERVIREHDIGYAVLVAERRSWLTRLLSRSPAVNIPAFEGCEIKVVEENGTDNPNDEVV